MTARPLTVYAGLTFRRGKQVRVVVAAPSKAAAMRALGVSRTEFRDYFHKAERPEDVEPALSRPGTLFWQPTPTPFGAPLAQWDDDTEETSAP